nr:KxYKxGKxW signal peptide domain-containing protein [Weissella confusa]
MQNRGEQNVHFKMYKDGKRWVTRGLVLGAVGLMVVAPIATTNLQLTHVKNVIAATTGRSLTQNEQAQIDRLQSVIDGYRFVQGIAETNPVWQNDLSNAIDSATKMIDTIKSGEYTQKNGADYDGAPFFRDQQVQFKVDAVEDYALAIEVDYIRSHDRDWYNAITANGGGKIFADITSDVLDGYTAGSDAAIAHLKHQFLEIVDGYLAKNHINRVDEKSPSDDKANGNGSTGSSSSVVDNGSASSTTNPGSSAAEQAAGNGSTGSNSSSAVDDGTASSTTNPGSSAAEQANGNGSTGSNSSAADNGTASSTTNPGSSADEQAAGNGSTGSNSSVVDNGSESSTTNPGSSSDEQAAGNGSTGSNSSAADNGTTSSTTNSSSVASSAVNEQVAGSESATSNSLAVDNGATTSMTNSSSVASSAATVRVSGNDLVNVVVNTPASVAPSATTGAVMNLASTATTNASTNNATTNANVVNGVSTVNNQTSASAANATLVASSAPVSGLNVNRINDTVSTTPQAKMLHTSDDRQFDTLERSHVTETFLSVIIALIAALMYKVLRNNKRDEADDVLAEEDERLFSDVKKISKIKK